MATITSVTKINDENTSEHKQVAVKLGSATDLYIAMFSLEKVSGVNVTHGGASDYTTYLNYKRGTDNDFTDTIMNIVLTEKGTAVYKIKIYVVTKADKEAHDAAIIDFNNNYVTDEGKKGYLKDNDNNNIEPEVDILTTAENAPSYPQINYTNLSSENIEFTWE